MNAPEDGPTGPNTRHVLLLIAAGVLSLSAFVTPSDGRGLSVIGGNRDRPVHSSGGQRPHFNPELLPQRTYNKPRYMDDRLDWCLTWATDCGRPAALFFCNRRRFEDVADFGPDQVGRSAQTRLIGSGQVCNGDFCTAFSHITCKGPISSNRVFGNPVWKEHRLDLCREWATNCGKPAADAFCREKSFTESMHYVPDPEPGRSTTRVIGTDQICSGRFCTGFQQIICR